MKISLRKSSILLEMIKQQSLTLKNRIMAYKNSILALGIVSLMLGCKEEDVMPTVDSGTVINVDGGKFLTSTGSVTVTTESRTLSNGTTAPCYKIVTTSNPADHTRGPWCPTNISDDATKGGIWLSDGNVYDVDGTFIQNLATFYNDPTWQMYNTTTGAITKPLPRRIVRQTANPNVGAAYKNYCVECLPSYVSSITNTYYIPITPVYIPITPVKLSTS